MDQHWREITAEWAGGTTFLGRNPAGGSVQMGTLDDQPGISPMELLLVSLAGCTGADVASILEKERQPLQKLTVKARARRAESFPKVYQEIEVTYLLWGEGLDPVAIERAIRLSEEKYCSVGLMLKQVAPIRSEYYLNPQIEMAA